MVARLRYDEPKATPTDVSYEIHANRLCVNDECFSVSPRVIRLAFLAHHLETGVDYRGEDGPIPESIARQILKMERTRTLNALTGALQGIDATPRSDGAKSFRASAV